MVGISHLHGGMLHLTSLQASLRMAGEGKSDKSEEFYRDEGPRRGDADSVVGRPPVVLFVPSSEPICIRKTKSSGRLECKIPLGQYAGSHSHKKEDGFL
jgi:hypothetical protein